MCCGTTFSWRTGKIDHGHIHAPDYYRWLRQTGREIPRNPRDVPCGGMPTYQEITNVLCVLKKSVNNTYYVETTPNIYRLILHILRVEIPAYRVEDQRGDADNRDIRIKYMLNQVDDKKFKTVLQQREKAWEKKRCIYNVLQMVYMAGTDIFQRMKTSTNEDAFLACFNEFEHLRKYSVESMQNISTRFKCVTPQIQEDWKRVVTCH
jgi:hypothetical protein